MAFFGGRKSDALNVQLQFPWQLSNYRSSPRNVGDFGARFEGMVDRGDRWPFPRNLPPAVLKELPDQIIDHPTSACRTTPDLQKCQVGAAILAMRRHSRQDLGIWCEL